MLAVGRSTLYELIGSGRLATVHIGRSVRIPISELESFVAGHRDGVNTTRATPSSTSRSRRAATPISHSTASRPRSAPVSGDTNSAPPSELMS
jgi:excisionase family DNA binding protein